MADVLKFENLAEVGDTIRAYDFMGMDNSYIEGEVISKGWITHPVSGVEVFKGYTIEIRTAKTLDEDEKRVGDVGYVPFESSFDYDDRIIIIKD